LSEQQVLEGHVISIEALLEKEKTVLKNQENSIKILTQVPCHDQFPDCKFIRDSHKNKKKIEKQSQEITNIKSEMSLLKSSLRKLKKRSLEDKIKKYNEILLQESVIQKQFGDKNLLLSNEKNKKDALSFRLDTMSANCESMKLRVSNSSEASRISKCRKAIEKIENEIIDIDVERISCAEKISRALLSIENLEKEKETYHSLLNQWRAYDFFTSAVSSRGIPMTIIDDRLPIINDEISKILQGVTGFTVELDAPKFSNSMEIYINYGDSRRIIECASGMEKLMASLAIRVALINVSNLPKTSMLIIDEGFGALDDTNIEACSRLLESLKKWFKHIVVISHVDAVKDIADGILEISKIGKDSFITNV
jgi:DNA repair exonuclease SbcCD ATPase subunit